MYEKICQILCTAIDAGKDLPETNGAYKIYNNLYIRFGCYPTIEMFWTNNPECKKQFDELVAYVEVNGKHNDRTNKLHILSSYMQELLSSRFIKEEKRSPDITMHNHIIDWFNKNAFLNYDTDRIIVQAAFILMFYM